MRWNTSKIRHSSLIPSQICQNQSGIEFLVDLGPFRLCLSNNILAVLISVIIHPWGTLGENVSHISCKTSIICIYCDLLYVHSPLLALLERTIGPKKYIHCNPKMGHTNWSIPWKPNETTQQMSFIDDTEYHQHHKSAGLMHQHQPTPRVTCCTWLAAAPQKKNSCCCKRCVFFLVDHQVA